MALIWIEERKPMMCKCGHWSFQHENGKGHCLTGTCLNYKPCPQFVKESDNA